LGRRAKDPHASNDAKRPCSAAHNSKRSAAVVRPLEHEVRPLSPIPSDGIQRQVTVVALLENDLIHMSLFRIQNHRITFVARNMTDSGIVSLSALAVFRLTATSNTVGCSMGSSDGLAPLRILSTKKAARLKASSPSIP